MNTIWKKFFIVSFVVILFVLPSSPTKAEGVGRLSPFCFTRAECTGPPYNGHPSIENAPECKGNEELEELGFVHYCYASPPSIDLQVSLGIGKYQVAGLEDYIRTIYIFLVGIAGITSGIMIVWAGIKWLTSAGASERISDAKKKIAGAIMGLVLVLGSFIIFQTVNPALTRLQLPPIRMARQELAGGEQCIDRSTFPCGAVYQCDDSQYISNPPCGTVRPGKCTGQYCLNKDCATISSAKIVKVESELFLNRELDPNYIPLMTWVLQLSGVNAPSDIIEYFNLNWSSVNYRDAIDASIAFGNPVPSPAASQGEAASLCVSSNDCSNCGNLTPSDATADQIYGLLKCISSSCNCILTFAGSGGSTDYIYPKCQNPLSAPSEDTPTIECEHDDACAGGVCNTATDECGPSGPNTNCNRDRECASGLCNTEVEPWGSCQNEASQPGCAECDRPNLCASGLCGSDGECAAVSGEHSTDDDGDGDYCD